MYDLYWYFEKDAIWSSSISSLRTEKSYLKVLNQSPFILLQKYFLYEFILSSGYYVFIEPQSSNADECTWWWWLWWWWWWWWVYLVMMIMMMMMMMMMSVPGDDDDDNDDDECTWWLWWWWWWWWRWVYLVMIMIMMMTCVPGDAPLGALPLSATLGAVRTGEDTAARGGVLHHVACKEWHNSQTPIRGKLVKPLGMTF